MIGTMSSFGPKARRRGGVDNNRGRNEENHREGRKSSFQIVGGKLFEPYGFRKGGGAFRVLLFVTSTAQLKN